LIDPKADFKEALECYLRGNCFEKALKLCYEAETSRLETHVRPALLVAIDIKRN
jgi:elongator complex protein 1